MKLYFEYVGVAYPIGRLHKDAIIQFSSVLIVKVIHSGFSDAKEEAFVMLMKDHLIVEKESQSYDYLDANQQAMFAKLRNLTKSEIY